LETLIWASHTNYYRFHQDYIGLSVADHTSGTSIVHSLSPRFPAPIQPAFSERWLPMADEGLLR
ncbi:MAG: hypothetical protein ACYS74_06385, partial [Planctomycetota bacterium]